MPAHRQLPVEQASPAARQQIGVADMGVAVEHGVRQGLLVLVQTGDPAAQFVARGSQPRHHLALEVLGIDFLLDRVRHEVVHEAGQFALGVRFENRQVASQPRRLPVTRMHPRQDIKDRADFVERYRRQHVGKAGLPVGQVLQQQGEGLGRRVV